MSATTRRTWFQSCDRSRVNVVVRHQTGLRSGMRLFTPGNAAAPSVSGYLLPDERQVATVRVHPAIIIGPLLILVFASLAVAGVYGVLGGMVYANRDALITIWLVWGALALSASWMADQSYYYFVVTSSRILIANGLVSRNVWSIPFAEVADIKLQRSVGGRLLGYGKLIVKATARNKTLPDVRFVPYPEQVYHEICFVPAVGDPPISSALRIQKILDPVSLFSIVRSLERISGNRGLDSLAVARERFYSTVADGFLEDESLERRPELRRYLADYRDYSRRRNTLRSVSLAAIYLAVLIDLLMVVAWWFWSHNAPNTFRTSLVTAIVVTILGPCLSWLITRRIHYLDSRPESAASRIDKQILNEFKSFWLELSLELEGVTDRKRRLDPMLRSFNAPTLIELESSRVQRSASFEYILEFLKNHITSAVGVAGVRGSGKTTLLRWIQYELEPTWIVLYLSAPAIYDTVDFVRTIFTNTVREVISKRSAELRQRRLSLFVEPFRKPSIDRRIVLLSERALVSITGLRSDQRSTSAGISGRGVSLKRGWQTTWTERELSHPELVEAFKTYLEQYRRLESRSIAIAIDELDKLTSVDDAIAVINGIKDLFHIPNTHFIISVSEDAMSRFAMRGIPFRDVFDSAFDTIEKIQALSPDDALRILARRAEEFPVPVALFCYAWSAALPRDLIRIARSCVDIARRADRAVSVTELAPKIVRRDAAAVIDEAIIKNLESGHASGVDGLLTLRHQIRDETIPLESVMEACKLEGARSTNGTSEDSIALRRFLVYMEIGSVVCKYFSDRIITLLSDDFDQVLDVVENLASAKAALAMYPPEAEWFLFRARANMDLHADG